MEAPFPYFGGKAAVAGVIWRALGDVKHYIEPFCGSAAVLLARPDYQPGRHVETIVDKDGHVANVWRALQADPDEVARWCDWPVNHCDLAARKRRLLAEGANLLERLVQDDEYYDAKLAGYWIWASSCWIGSGMTRLGQRPHLTGSGSGVHRLSQRYTTGMTGLGQRPHLTGSGSGVHRLSQRHTGDEELPDVRAPYNRNIYTWFRQLSERLRYVRVVCGDWTRVCGGDWQDHIGTCGIFFDPPYAVPDRDSVYDHDSYDVANAVRAWCLERGERENYRIVLAGYEEHEELLQHGWSCYYWQAVGGYANTGNGRGKANRKRERLYISPHCLHSEQLTLQLQA